MNFAIWGCANLFCVKSRFCDCLMIAVSINLWNHGRKHDFGWTISIIVLLSTRLRDEHSLRQLLTTTAHFIYVYIFTFQWGHAGERCNLVRFKAVCTCFIYHGPFARYVKLWVAHAQGIRRTFSPPPTSIFTYQARGPWPTKEWWRAPRQMN